MHDIDHAEWKLYAKMDKYHMRSNEYLVPENIDTLPDSDIVKYLTSKGIKVSNNAIRKAREQLTDKLRKYILERSSIALSDLTPSTKTTLNQGTQAFTVQGKLMRFIAKFKAFPVSFMYLVGDKCQPH